jgi:multiple sugar transport system permease protein
VELPHARRRKSAEWGSLLLLLSPTIVVLLALVAYPLIRVVSAAFTDAQLVSLGDEEFVGFDNFVRHVKDPAVRKAAVRTFVYSASSVLVSYVIGLGMAFLVERFRRRMKAFLRGLFLVPYVTSAVVIAILFRYMLDPQVGVINYLLGSVGLSEGTTSWLTDPTLAMFAVVLATVWQHAPFFMLMIAAGLQGIPEDINDAAAVDGATGWTKFSRITFPLLMPITAISITVMGIRLLNACPIIWTMTEGGPVNATTTTVIQVYALAFKEYSLGASSALGAMWLIVTMVIAVVYLYFSRRSTEV